MTTSTAPQRRTRRLAQGAALTLALSVGGVATAGPAAAAALTPSSTATSTASSVSSAVLVSGVEGSWRFRLSAAGGVPQAQTGDPA